MEIILIPSNVHQNSRRFAKQYMCSPYLLWPEYFDTKICNYFTFDNYSTLIMYCRIIRRPCGIILKIFFPQNFQISDSLDLVKKKEKQCPNL